MTQQWTPQWTNQPAQPVTPPSTPKKRTGLKLMAYGAAGVTLLGIGGIVGGQDNKPSAAAPQPAVTITATATSTQTKTVSEVPAECKLALDEADKMIQIFSDSMNIVVEVLNAAARYDVKTINAAVPKMDAQTEKVKTNLYPTYRDRCRGYVK